MVHIIASVGDDPQPFLRSLRSGHQPHSVTLVVEDAPEDLTAADSVEVACRARDIQFSRHVVSDPAPVAAGTVIRRLIRRADGPSRVVMAGGSRATTTAMMLAVVLEGVPADYIQEGRRNPVRLPVMASRHVGSLAPSVRRILRLIKDNPGCSPRRLHELTGLSFPTIAHHLRTLSEKNLVGREPHPSDGRRVQLRALDGAELALDLEPGSSFS